MKKVFGALAVMALLASCNILDQTIKYADGTDGKDDPIGLKSKAVTVSLLSGPAARLQASEQTTSGVFSDIDTSSVPGIVQLKEWGFTLDLSTPAVVTPNTLTCPSSLSINVDALTLNVKDAANAAGVSAPVTFTPSVITLTETATNCTYAVPAAPVKVSASIKGAALTSLVGIITAGGQNTVTATLTTTTTPALTGGSIQLVFGSGTGFVIAGI